jgi:double-stranded uracil-DNA glycosylase
MLSGLAPVVSGQTRLLVLGSFPGAASLAAQQYYAHPRNQFWLIVTQLLASNPPAVQALGYPARCDWLLSVGLGLWDVYAACEREGSLDLDIRNAQPNNFAALRSLCPALQAIAHNGAESFKHARQTAALGVPVTRLPSTSPANASWSFARKLAAWQAVFAQYGLL